MAKQFEASLLLKINDQLTERMRKIQSASRKSAKKVAKYWGTAAKDMSKRMDKAAKKIEKGQAQIRKGFETMAKGAAIAAPFALAAKSAADFQRDLAEVATLTDKSAQDIIKSYGPLVAQTQMAFGKDSQGVIKAFYDGVSAGVPETKQAVSEYLKAVGEMAVGGKTDMASAADVITTAMNAWKINDFQAISDAMFTTVRQGKTTMTELSASLGQVASTASGAGVSLDETMAAIATLTVAGVKTPQAMTQVAAAINSIRKPTDAVSKLFKKLKLDITPMTLEQKGLAGTLDMVTSAINKHTKSQAKRKEMLAKLLPNLEADKAVTALVGAQNEKFSSTLDKMNKKTGAASDAFGKIASTDALKFDQAMQELKVSWRAFGAAALPVLSDLLKDIRPVITSVGEWIGENKGLVTTITKFGLALSGIVTGLGVFKTVMGAAKIAQAALNVVMTANPIGLIIVAIGALVGAVWWLYDNWEGVTDLWNTGTDSIWATMKAVYERIKLGVMIVSDWFNQRTGGMVDYIKEKFEVVANLFKSLMPDWMQEGLGKVWEIVKNIMGHIWGYIKEIWNRIKEIFSGIGDFFGNMFSSIGDWIVGDYDVNKRLQEDSGFREQIQGQVARVRKTTSDAVQANRIAGESATRLFGGGDSGSGDTTINNPVFQMNSVFDPEDPSARKKMVTEMESIFNEVNTKKNRTKIAS